MSRNFWDDQEPFRDQPGEYKNGQWQDTETYTPAPENTLRKKTIAMPVEETLEDIEYLVEQVQEEDEDDYESVLSDARLRLEQGKLYEMIMNHNLFEGVDSDPRAAKSVQKQIRKFAKEQMEIMLGMRTEATVNSGGMVSSPFNDLEVDVLKKIASAASKGATESQEAQTVAPAPQAKKKTLNSIGVAKTQPKVQAKPIQKKVEPIQRTKSKLNKNLPPEFEPDYEPLNKPLHEMTSEELIERDKQAAERQAGRKSAAPTDAAPMPDYATQEMMAMGQVNRAVGMPSKGNLSAMIVANLKNNGKI